MLNLLSKHIIIIITTIIIMVNIMQKSYYYFDILYNIIEHSRKTSPSILQPMHSNKFYIINYKKILNFIEQNNMDCIFCDTGINLAYDIYVGDDATPIFSFIIFKNRKDVILFKMKFSKIHFISVKPKDRLYKKIEHIIQTNKKTIRIPGKMRELMTSRVIDHIKL